jgi:hypothetical protein
VALVEGKVTFLFIALAVPGFRSVIVVLLSSSSCDEEKHEKTEDQNDFRFFVPEGLCEVDTALRGEEGAFAGLGAWADWAPSIPTVAAEASCNRISMNTVREAREHTGTSAGLHG